jgi:hypothetical protein
VTYPGFTPVGNATLVVANVLTCNKHSPYAPSAVHTPVPACLHCIAKAPAHARHWGLTPELCCRCCLRVLLLLLLQVNLVLEFCDWGCLRDTL